MPATVPTTENFSARAPKAQMKEAQRLRLTAGAIDSNVSGSEAAGLVLTTAWNVIGEQ